MPKQLEGNVLAGLLSARSAAVVDDITTRVVERIRERGGLELDLTTVKGSVQDNINLLLHLLANPAEAATALPPQRTVSTVHAMARRGIPLFDVVDAYLLAERCWIRACLEELADLSDDVPSLSAAALYLWDIDHLFVEHSCRVLADEYEKERARWVEHGQSLRTEAIQALLSGDWTGDAHTEAALGYRLRGRHVAAIVWVADHGVRKTEPLRFDGAISALKLALGGVNEPLVESRDRFTRWVWVPVPKGMVHDPAAVRDVLSSVDSTFRIAYGESDSGVPGFARSHRQASAAYSVGQHVVPPDRRALVVSYREVGAIAFLTADLARAKDWVTQTLGDLAVGAPRENDLRHTLEVYLESGQSIATAARVLQCHRNTVHYRLSVAEKLLGHPVSDGVRDLPLALATARWLGPAVLTAEADDAAN